MYAVIRAGGKQHKVAEGDVIEVERLKDGGDTVEFTPLLVVEDNGTVTSGRSDLASARVTARVVGEAKGPKIEVYKYKNKSGYRRHMGHRQSYSKIEISGIALKGDSKKKAAASKPAATKKTAEEGAE